MKILLPIGILVVAVIGVLLGLWKIDTFGLAFILIGSYLVLRAGLWKILGLVMMAFGVALWLDYIGISGAGL